MKRFFRGVYRFLRGVFVALLLVALVCLVALTCFEQRVPEKWLRSLERRLASSNLVVSVGSASFRFTRGVRLADVRFFNPAKKAAPPIMRAERVDVALALTHLPWTARHLVRGVTVTGFSYPRLPDGYYIPDSIEFPGQPDFREVDAPVELSLPTLDTFPLTLVAPEILGVKARRVEVARVRADGTAFTARGIHLVWPDSDTLMTLDGEVEMDLADQCVRGEVRGQARQHGILPMLEALEITNSYAWVNAWTQVEPPVESVCKFDVNLRNNDLHIALDLSPVGGRYNNVPLEKVHGNLDIRVFVRDTFQNAHIAVGPIDAHLADGRTMAGTVLYHNINDIGFVDFDVLSKTSLSNALAVADYLTDGSLDCLDAGPSPVITLKGRLAVDPRHAAGTNDLRGTLSFDAGSFFGIPLRNAATAFHVKGTSVSFSDAAATAPHGGRVHGSGRIDVPDFKRDNAAFSVDVKGEELALADLAEAVGFDLGDRKGLVSGRLRLAGPLGETNLVARLTGDGHFSCKDGHLAQMKLFAGLTAFLANHVPGVSALVNQTAAEMDFTITNGVFRTTNCEISGTVFSVGVKGSYDMARDNLNLKARVTFARSHSLLDVIKLPFSTLSGLILDFTLTGPLDDPKLGYNPNLLDRLPSLK